LSWQGNPLYRRISSDPDGSLALQAARVLIFQGVEQPSGYIKPLLHKFRQRLKAAG